MTHLLNILVTFFHTDDVGIHFMLETISTRPEAVMVYARREQTTARGPYMAC